MEADRAQQRVEEAVARLVEHQLPDDAGGDAGHDPRRQDDDAHDRDAGQAARDAAAQGERDQQAEGQLQDDAGDDEDEGRPQDAGKVGIGGDRLIAGGRVAVVRIEQRRVGEAVADDVEAPDRRRRRTRRTASGASQTSGFSLRRRRDLTRAAPAPTPAPVATLIAAPRQDRFVGRMNGAGRRTASCDRPAIGVSPCCRLPSPVPTRRRARRRAPSSRTGPHPS